MSVDAGIGSIVSSPPWMAARTERRESQFSEGARSSRTVGSLYSNISCRTGSKEMALTSPQLVILQETAMEAEWP
jgi:hypothetical protein